MVWQVQTVRSEKRTETRDVTSSVLNSSNLNIFNILALKKPTAVRQVQGLTNVSCGTVSLPLRILMIQSNVAGRDLSNTAVKVVCVKQTRLWEHKKLPVPPSDLPVSQFHPGIAARWTISTWCLVNYICSLWHCRLVSPSTGLVCLFDKPVLASSLLWS